MQRKHKSRNMIYSLFILIFIFLIGLFLATIVAWGAIDIKFAWDANTEEDLAGYRLYQSNVSGLYTFGQEGAYIDIAKDLTEYTLMNFSESSRQYWVLTAYDDKGNESGPSNEVSYLLDSNAPMIPQDFVIFTDMYIAGNYTLIFRWTKNIEPDLKEYRLYFSEISNQYDPNVYVEIDPNMIMYSFISIIDKPLFFSLRAVDTNGNISEYSNEVVFLPDLEAPMNPRGLIIMININVQ